MDLTQNVVIVPLPLHNEDNLPLTQFNILNVAFIEKENGTKAEIELHFRRKITYHLANTFAPTLSLLVIVEITLFFDEEKQGMAVTLALTVLLVMYTFYQSISSSIPKTAYLKLIDYWLIFCLLVPFAIFIILNIWYLTAKLPNKVKGIIIPKEAAKCKKLSKRQMMHITIVGLTFAITATYFLVAFYIF